jgi:hypothetical protein
MIHEIMERVYREEMEIEPTYGDRAIRSRFEEILRQNFPQIQGRKS